MNPDHIAALVLGVPTLAGAVLWGRSVQLQLKRAKREQRIERALEQAGPCDTCRRYLGTVLVAVRDYRTGATVLQLVCQGCADAGTAHGRCVVVSRKARRAS